MSVKIPETPHHYREGELKVPQLKGWGYFADDEDLVWRVRMATSAELFRAREAPERQQQLFRAALSLASAGAVNEGELRKIYGLDSADTPAELTRRIDLLMWTSIHPVIGPDNREKLVELSETHPLVFTNLTNLVDQLSGLGAQLGKRKPSGKEKT